MNENLFAVIEKAVANRDAACFITEKGVRLSYDELFRNVGLVACYLTDRGIGPGDRVMVQVPKSIEMVELYLATLKIGAIFVPINTAYKQSEVQYFLDDAEPKLFVTDAREIAREAAGLTPLAESAQRGRDDIAAIVYTSGTTGRSKGAMLTHGNLASNGLALVEAWGFTQEDVLLHTLPVFHVHGLFVALHCALLSNSSVIWLDRFDEDLILERLAQATVMMGVPTYYTRLLANPALTAERAEGIRLFISGSAPLLETAFHAFEQRTGKRIVERYGMSESAIITTNPLVGKRIAGSVGYPLPGVALRVSGGEEIGMIEIRGPNVFAGYWRNPEKTDESFTADGYFITGDLGRTDADGRLWITGRAKDLVISGGYNVYPKELELVIDETEGVIESAVIGVPHPDFGEAVVAVVVGSAEERDVIDFASARLASFKVPKRVFQLPALPRNALGKVEKNKLRDMFGQIFAADHHA